MRTGLLRALAERKFSATKVASSGSFLRRGNVTIFTGVSAERVDEVIAVVRTECHARREFVPVEGLPFEPIAGTTLAPIEVRAGGAIVFVLEVSRFERV